MASNTTRKFNLFGIVSRILKGTKAPEPVSHFTPTKPIEYKETVLRETPTTGAFGKRPRFPRITLRGRKITHVTARGVFGCNVKREIGD